MRGSENGRFRWYERLFGVRFLELAVSLPVWLGFFLTRKDGDGLGVFLAAWVVMGLLTGIANHVGIVTRHECRDFRFMWLSIHGKLPRWVLWVFWPLAAAVLFRPAFGVPALLAAGLAFYRGFHFQRCCMGCRMVILADFAARAVSGFMV